MTFLFSTRGTSTEKDVTVHDLRDAVYFLKDSTFRDSVVRLCVKDSSGYIIYTTRNVSEMLMFLNSIAKQGLHHTM